MATASHFYYTIIILYFLRFVNYFMLSQQNKFVVNHL